MRSLAQTAQTICALLFVLSVVPGDVRAATITVTGTGDTIAADGQVTLREAITAINLGANTSDVVAVGAYGVNDAINFNIAGAGVHTITVGSALPQITKTINIDGYSQPGSSPNTLTIGDNAVLNIVLDGVTGTFNGLQGSIFQPPGSVFRGLVIQRFATGLGIQSGNTAVTGNFIGTNPTGTAAAGNSFGIAIAFNNSFGAPVQGNNTIGGPLPADRNVISGNTSIGLILNNSGAASSVMGNYVGVNAAGAAALGNGIGIYLGEVGTSGTLAGPSIGGITATPGTGPGNVISGNSSGDGIRIQDSGGATEFISAGTIQGNIIGLDATGTVAIPNVQAGIRIDDQTLGGGGAAGIGPITIGGTAAGSGNIISANNDGISVVGAGSVIQRNRIGTDISGTIARPNTTTGVIIGTIGFALSFGSTSTIGGAGAGNLISGNTGAGIQLRLSTASILGNLIGTAADGTTPLGNSTFAGVGVIVDSSEAVIGDGTTANTNTIANNGGVGVDVKIQTAGHATSDALISGNSIYQNGVSQPAFAKLGINLDAADLVTPNDLGDPDTGPNGLQNYPVLTTATAAAGNVTVSGTLNSTPISTIRLEFFSNLVCEANTIAGPGFGEGKTFLGFTTVTTDATGNASFGPTTFAAPIGEAVITSTATNAANQTSEFSACVTAAVAAPPTLSINNVTAAEGNAGNTPFTFTVTLSAPSATPVTVNYATADGTATAGSDYVATSGTLTFAPGVVSQTITVNVIGDTTVEPNETFVVNLSAPSGATILTGQGTGTINNDDVAPTPTLSINNVTTAEGNAGNTPFTFTVTLSAASATAVTVNYATADGTATAGSDYVATSGTLTFAPGVVSQAITVNVIGDTTVEPNETFVVNLSAPSGATILTGQGTGTIVNDDVAPAAIPALDPSVLALLMLALGAAGLVAINKLSN